MRVSAGLTPLTVLEFHSNDNLEVSYTFCKVSTSLLLLVDDRTFLRYLYTCLVQLSLYGNNMSA